MSTDDAVLDIQKLSRQEFVARSILPRFPLSTLKIEESQAGKIFDIYFQEKLILSLNKRGARYFFPSRRKRMLKWDKASSFGLARTVDYIIRDLAEANYEVFSITNKQILKRPVHISRYLRCPECGNGGGIKIIMRGEVLAPENSQIYTPISRSMEINGAQIKCTLCGWIGVRAELRGKIRKPRN